MDQEKLIIILSVIVILLVLYKIVFVRDEPFEQVEICDYNSPDPSAFCKSITKGCTDLLHTKIDLDKNMNDNCSTLPTDTRDIINVAINCDDNNNKLIMNEYVQKEVCGQIKNFPTTIPLPDNEEDMVPPQEEYPPASYEPVSEYSIRDKGYASF